MGKIIETGRVPVADAAKELGMSVDSFRYLLQEGKFPICIGYAIRKPGNKNYTYMVYRKPLEELKQLMGMY